MAPSESALERANAAYVDEEFELALTLYTEVNLHGLADDALPHTILLHRRCRCLPRSAMHAMLLVKIYTSISDSAGSSRQAIAAQPGNAGLYSARAQTHIKLEDWMSAAEDAGKAAQMEPRSAKANFRKGCAAHPATPAAVHASALEGALIR